MICCHRRRLFLLGLAAAGASAAIVVPLASQPAPAGVLVFFGTYTGPSSTSKGIYVSRLDATTGQLSAPALAAETRNPSFLAATPDGRFLYAVNELNEVDGQPGGSVTAYAIDRTAGTLRRLNAQSTVGGGPCHVSVAGRMVFVANYGGGSIAAYRIQDDGSLGKASAFVQLQGSSVNKDRQQGPHAHGVTPDPSGRFLYVPDLGLDQVLVYRIEASSGGLSPAVPPYVSVTPAGSGPRHIVLARDGRHAYVINEMVATITVFARVADTGALSPIQTLTTLPAGQAVEKGFSTAEIMLHPSGRFLYGSNRGHNSLAVYGVDPATGQLTPIEHVPTGGRTPRGFNIDPSGTFLVAGNQESDQVAVFRIDPASGKLSAAGTPIAVGRPVSIEFVR